MRQWQKKNKNKLGRITKRARCVYNVEIDKRDFPTIGHACMSTGESFSVFLNIHFEGKPVPPDFQRLFKKIIIKDFKREDFDKGKVITDQMVI